MNKTKPTNTVVETKVDDTEGVVWVFKEMEPNNRRGRGGSGWSVKVQQFVAYMPYDKWHLIMTGDKAKMATRSQSLRQWYRRNLSTINIEIKCQTIGDEGRVYIIKHSPVEDKK